MAYIPTSQSLLHLGVIPLWVGDSGHSIVKLGSVRVVGVLGMLTQYHCPSSIPEQSDSTLGFQTMKSATEKVPNRLAMSLQVSP